MAQGETVNILINQNPATHLLNYQFTLKKPDGTTRVLRSNETLVLDSLICSLDPAAFSGGGTLQVFSAPPSNAATVGIVVGQFATSYIDPNGTVTPFGTGEAQFKHEGLSLPPGHTLWVVALYGNSWALFSGTGRIVLNSTQTGRQNWQSNLNP